jgi:DNA-binding helix-hairpin-helix protein with protein kinase domain
MLSLAALILFEPTLRFVDRATAVAFVAFGNLALIGFGYRREPRVAKLQRLRTQLSSLNGQIEERSRELQGAYAAKQDILVRIGLERRQFELRRSDLRLREAEDLRAALAALQREHMDAYLRSIPIDWVRIPGIGAANRATLEASGVKTAADIDVVRLRGIRGIGMTRRTHLYAWRDTLEPGANARTPRALDSTVEGQIRAAHRDRIVELDSELRATVARAELESKRLQEQANMGLEKLVGLRSDKERLEHERAELGQMTFASYARRVIFLG